MEVINKYVWLVDTIYRAGRITFEEITTGTFKPELTSKKAFEYMEYLKYSSDSELYQDLDDTEMLESYVKDNFLQEDKHGIKLFFFEMRFMIL